MSQVSHGKVLAKEILASGNAFSPAPTTTKSTSWVSIAIEDLVECCRVQEKLTNSGLQPVPRIFGSRQTTVHIEFAAPANKKVNLASISSS